MNLRMPLVATAVAVGLIAAAFGSAGPANAAATRPSHFSIAKADWTKGAKAVAATENQSWLAARHQLAGYGKKKYAHEQSDLTALTKIPLTNTTAEQRATAARDTRELNAFFRTPGLYDVKAGNPKKIAKADWIESSKVAAASANTWLGGTVDELDAYGNHYLKQREELTSLESIPLTDTTAKQRATARKDVRALDVFFKTPGVNA